MVEKVLPDKPKYQYGYFGANDSGAKENALITLIREGITSRSDYYLLTVNSGEPKKVQGLGLIRVLTDLEDNTRIDLEGPVPEDSR